MGPLATPAQLERIEETVAHAVANGGTLVHGGKKPASMETGWYYEPTIVACPSQDLDIVREEMFGPVLSVLKFKDEAEAISKLLQVHIERGVSPEVAAMIVSGGPGGAGMSVEQLRDLAIAVSLGGFAKTAT